MNVEGQDELRRRLEAMIDAMSGPIIKEVAEQAAQVSVEDAQAAAPEQTGEGARSIGPEVRLTKPHRAEVGVSWDEEHFYMRFQEVGWTDRGGTFHPGKNFLRNSVRNNEAEIESVVAEEARDLVLGAIRR